MATNSTGATGLPADFTYLQCPQYVDTLPQYCGYQTSFYKYRISFSANTAFIALYAAAALAFLVIFAFRRHNVSFTVAFLLGMVAEIIGYVGRLMSWKNQWQENPFLTQICCLTVAPAFMAAGIYFCLKSIIYAFGPDNSRINPDWYPRIFIPCDVVSLLLQAVGGGMAAVALNTGKDLTTGNNIMISGLAFQVFTMLVFMLFATDFAIRTIRKPAAVDHTPVLVVLRASWPFRLFLIALTLSTVCIFWRSVFRVAELSDGWTGYLMTRQDLFIGFEGIMVIVAVWALTIFHPNICFKEMHIIGRKKKNVAAAAAATTTVDSMLSSEEETKSRVASPHV
ncbi:RTA1 like protein-domain-containing protein [Xylariales sp. PMI_506]|nr:RTA1 like protein-domain-containing protein [Xylariales sp. PMI_506]